MLLLVVAACLGLSHAEPSICQEPRATPTSEDIATSVRDWLAADPVFAEASGTLDVILEIEECKVLFDEGVCYYHAGAARYAGVEGVHDLTFGLLAEGVPNARIMGNLLCTNLSPCWEAAKWALLVNEPFLSVMSVVMEDPAAQMERLDKWASENIPENYYTEVKAFIEKHGLEESVEGTVQTENWNAMESFNYVSEGMTAAHSWCEENPSCLDDTAEAVTGLMKTLHGAETCKPASFCGACQAAVVDYAGIPCCVTNIIDQAIEKIDEVKEMEEYDTGYSMAMEFMQIFYSMDEIKKAEGEAQCYRDSYEKLGECQPDCIGLACMGM